MRDLNVAVVIVNFRSAYLTVDCLRSLQGERTSAGLRVRAIIVENASGDLPEIQRAIVDNRWSDWVEVIAAPRNGGFAYGNNLGIERAYAQGRPSYIYLLNPDTQVRPGAIGALVRFLEAHPEIGIAGSSFENSDGSAWPIAFRFPNLLSELVHGVEFGPLTRLLQRWDVVRQMDQTPQRVDWISGASMMIRPAVFEAIGGLDESYFLYFEETDFCRRAHQAGFPTWYVPDSRVMHIGGQTTKVTDRTGMPSGRLPAYWFESRRRYFVVTFGIGRAILIDMVAVVARWLGWLKRLALRRRHTAIPHYIRDLVRASVLWSQNRQLPPARCLCLSAETNPEQRAVGNA